MNKTKPESKFSAPGFLFVLIVTKEKISSNRCLQQSKEISFCKFLN